MDFSCEADVDAAKKNYLMRVERKRQNLDSDDEDEDGDKKMSKQRKPNIAYNARDEFKTFKLNLPANAFPHLFPTVSLEPIGEGQQGAVLVYPDPEEGIPIVRSTTKFIKPAQIFQPLHHQLANEITTAASLEIPLNNILVEVFDNKCTGTEFQSMQAQDLAFCEESHIALFTCYKDPKSASRKLVVEAKAPGPGKDTFEIPLEPNSVVVWSLETNSHFRYKIVLDETNGKLAPDNIWMGFTFRTSSTCIQHSKENGDDETRARFGNGVPLLLLEGDRACSTIHRLRELENEGATFVYPSCLMSTISPGDLLPPVDLSKKEKEGNS